MSEAKTSTKISRDFDPKFGSKSQASHAQMPRAALRSGVWAQIPCRGWSGREKQWWTFAKLMFIEEVFLEPIEASKFKVQESRDPQCEMVMFTYVYQLIIQFGPIFFGQTTHRQTTWFWSHPFGAQEAPASDYTKMGYTKTDVLIQQGPGAQ